VDQEVSYRVRPLFASATRGRGAPILVGEVGPYSANMAFRSSALKNFWCGTHTPNGRHFDRRIANRWCSLFLIDLIAYSGMPRNVLLRWGA
jgi:hypothetical protein